MNETRAVPAPADFGGPCLAGECRVDPELMLPTTRYFGLEKAGSYLYCTVRDEDGNLMRMLRNLEADESTMRSLFVAEPGSQIATHPRVEEVWLGPIAITRDGDEVVFQSDGAPADRGFTFVSNAAGITWRDASVLSIAGDSVGPAIQWFNTWDGGACYSATAKYRVRGTFLGRSVEGFAGHEIHYFPAGLGWLDGPYGSGREICWQQIANEYEDGTLVQGTFAYGQDGWGFAMLHDEEGRFLATTDVRAAATVRPNGYPETIRYEFGEQSWTWRIDPQGERPMVAAIPMRGADGTCTRDGDDRKVRHSMGNSDWWTDGRADPIIVSS
jgi:hypothetical protein